MLFSGEGTLAEGMLPFGKLVQWQEDSHSRSR